MSGKIYGVMSVVPGNGAKYVATNLAKAVRHKDKSKRVLLVDFDFENPFLAYVFVKHDITHGIDNLLPHIHESGVNEEIFKENIISTRLGVDVLKGTQFAGKTKMFSRLHIETILNVAKKLYDVVIVVISSKANNAGTIYTLLHADQLIMVLRNNYSNELKLDKVVDVVQHYYRSENPVLLVYNFQNIHSKAGVNEKLQSFSIEVKVVGVLEYDERSIDNIDLDKKESLFSKSVNTKAFIDIAKQLA